MNSITPFKVSVLSLVNRNDKESYWCEKKSCCKKFKKGKRCKKCPGRKKLN